MPRYLSLTFKVNMRCKECGEEVEAELKHDNNEIDITVVPCEDCKLKAYREGYEAAEVRP